MNKCHQALLNQDGCFGLNRERYYGKEIYRKVKDRSRIYKDLMYIYLEFNKKIHITNIGNWDTTLLYI